MATFYPKLPGVPETLTVILDHKGRVLKVTLPYTTLDSLEIRAIRRQWAPREVPGPGE